jgi:hypothetical protein
MTVRALITGITVLCFMVTLGGCGTVPEEHKGAAVGAGAGAVAGAIIGGSSTKGAVIGGLLGALIGGAIGHYAYDQRKSREETVSTYKYESSQGTVISIEKAESLPAETRGGESIDLKVTYAVLTPSARDQVTITEIREITHNGNLVGRPEVMVDRKGGTYVSSVPLRLPAEAEKGTYQVAVTIQSERAKDSRQFSFVVE